MSLRLDEQKWGPQADIDQLIEVLGVPTVSQDDLVQRLPAHHEQDQEHAFHASLPPDNRNYSSDNSTEPTDGSHLAPLPMGVPPKQQFCLYPERLDLSKKVLAQSRPAHNEQGQEQARLYLSNTTTEPTDASHRAPYPMGVPPEQQFCFYREELDPSNKVLARSLPAHNEQDQEHASDTGLSPDNHHYFSDTSTEPTDASHLAPYPRCVPPEQQICFHPQEHHLSKNVLAQSLPPHNEQVREHAFHTSLATDNRYSLSEKAIKPADASHLAPFPMREPPKQQSCVCPEELDLFNTFLAERPELQNDLKQCLFNHNKRVQGTFHTGLPPDGQIDSHTIVWFDSSRINSLYFHKDIGANQAECHLIATGTVLNHNVHALGLLLILALLWIARNTLKKCCRKRGGCEMESHLIDVSLEKGRLQELRAIQMRSLGTEYG